MIRLSRGTAELNWRRRDLVDTVQRVRVKDQRDRSREGLREAWPFCVSARKIINAATN